MFSLIYLAFGCIFLIGACFLRFNSSSRKLIETSNDYANWKIDPEERKEMQREVKQRILRPARFLIATAIACILAGLFVIGR